MCGMAFHARGWLRVLTTKAEKTSTMFWFRNLLIYGFGIRAESKKRKLSHSLYVVLSKRTFYDKDTILYPHSVMEKTLHISDTECLK